MSAVRPIASKFCAPQRKTPSAKSGCEQLQQDRPLFEHLVGAGKKRRRHVDAERFRGSEIDN
jgi:hypothetical protein